MARPPALLHPELKDPPQMIITDPDRIRIYREARRISLRRLAKVCGCTHTAIANYETGVTKTIPEDRAGMLALVLGFPMASVFRPTEGFVVPEITGHSGMAESA